MKKALITMLIFFLWMTLGIGAPILKSIVGGDASEEFLYPIYWGIILLSGLIVFSTQLIIEEIRKLNR